ncbi:MAG TPA: choice-of-anchor J domain-containing protein, partial [Usitatibacter sp.]|nr:choice-of-anchor J domain-containing protein [Usitatibacter sp.]
MKFALYARRAATLLAATLGLALGAHAQSMPPAVAPAPAKAVEAQAFKVAPGSIPAAHVRLEAPERAAIEAVKQGNRTERFKALQIGLGQEVTSALASDKALLWMPAPGGVAAHWQVSSDDAKALRVSLDVTHMPAGVEIRFVGSGSIGTVYGPVTATDILKLGSPYWSPVLEGDTATIEVFVPGGAPRAVLAIGLVSHLFVSPSDAKAEQLAKASGACEVDFICRAAGDAQLAQTGRSVARMTFTSSSGGTGLCTGTLLNPSDNTFTPYFYSAAHCISTQSRASTLTTHWFYENTSCGGGSISPSYVQIPGGATLLHANTTSDALFVRLNSSPPSEAVYAGWNAATVATGTSLTAIHHPQGDPKKVSIGTAGGFGSSSLAPGGSFLIANWNSLATGVTEGGSSGSGIFSGNASEGYRFRGGLLGGPSSCSAGPGELFDYYSRLDQVYGSISQWLNPVSQGPQGPNVVANPGFESGATAWSQSSSAGASIITNDAGNARSGSWYAWLGGANSVTETLTQDIVVPSTQPRLQFWYRIGTNETVPGDWDIMSVTIASASSGTVLATVTSFSNQHATNGWTQSSMFDLSAFAGQTVRLRFAVSTDSSDSTSFRVDDVSVTGSSAGSGANYTALWWNAPGNSESGWGMNFVQQGDIAFATLFTYDLSGAPMWLFMSRGDRQGSADSFSGPLYRATGPAFYTSPFPSIGAGNLTQVGTMTVSFSGANSGTLSYSVNGVSVTKSITKQVYGTAAATCQGTSGSRASATNYQDLWWNYPANSESGWGLNITHQGNILFGTLFTYDANNRD